MKTVEATGYNKQKALESTGLDITLEMCKNATQAWKKANSPISPKELNKFMSEYMKRNKLSGAYIVVDPSSDDTRLRPYEVINETTQGKRKTKTTYQVKEAEFKIKCSTKTVVDEETGETKEVEVKSAEVIAMGAVEARADKKATALQLMKELIEENKKDYVIEICKEVTEGQKYAAYGSYTPSKSAKLGKFMFFSNEL